MIRICNSDSEKYIDSNLPLNKCKSITWKMKIYEH